MEKKEEKKQEPSGRKSRRYLQGIFSYCDPHQRSAPDPGGPHVVERTNNHTSKQQNKNAAKLPLFMGVIMGCSTYDIGVRVGVKG